jgi:hypothetical protein
MGANRTWQRETPWMSKGLIPNLVGLLAYRMGSIQPAFRPVRRPCMAARTHHDVVTLARRDHSLERVVHGGLERAGMRQRVLLCMRHTRASDRPDLAQPNATSVACAARLPQW